MANDQYLEMFKYIQEFRGEVNDRFDDQKSNINILRTDIEAYANKIDTYALEMAAFDHKMQRLEKYIQILADKIGVDLESIKI